MNDGYDDGEGDSDTGHDGGVREVSPDEEYYGSDEDMISPNQSPSSSPLSRTSSFVLDDDDNDEEEEENDDGEESSVTDHTTATEQNPAGEWVEMSPLVHARYRFASATINGRFYVFGGRGIKRRPVDKEKLNNVEFFTPETGTWIDTIPPMVNRRSCASAAVVDDEIYIIGGGENSDNSSSSVLKFNVTTSTFKDVPPMQSDMSHHVSITIEDKIYIIGARKHKRNQIFDTRTLQWTYMPKLIQQRYMCAAVAVGSKIYCIGGMKELSVQEHERYLNTMEVYDTKSNTWILSEATMKNRRAGCCAVTDGVTITVIGGRDEKNDVLAIEEYDIKKDEWRPSSSYRSLERGRSEFAAMLVERNLIIIGGICDIKNSFKNRAILDSVQICTDTLNSEPFIRAGIWKSNSSCNLKRSRSPSMRQHAISSSFDHASIVERDQGARSNMSRMTVGRFRFAWATFNDRLYVFGGSTEKKRLGHTEMFTLETGTWVDTIPPMDMARSGASAAVVDDDIYIIGGVDDHKDFSSSVLKFNVTTSTFKDVPPMQNERKYHVSISIGCKIYVFGSLRRTSNEIFDTRTSQWTYMPKLIQQRYMCAAVAVGHKIYCIGGMNEGSNHYCNRYLNTLEVFDTLTNTWTLSEATMKNRRAGCCAVTDGVTITVIGGRDEENDILAIEEYSIEKDEWVPSSSYHSLEIGRSEFAAMLVERNMIIIGGIRDNNKSSTGIVDSVEICENQSNSSLPTRREIEDSNTTSSVKTPSYNYGRGQTSIPKGKEISRATALAGKRKSGRFHGRKKQRIVTDKAPSLKFRIAKAFENGVHFGTATKNKEYWDVVYDDGDGEEFDDDELDQGKNLFYAMRRENQNPSLGTNSHALFGKERFNSFQKTKDLMQRRILHFETALFGQTSTEPLIDRLSYLEQSLEIVQTSDSLKTDRLDSLEDVIKSKSQAIEKHEVDLFGEIKEGPLKERWTKLQELQF